MHVQVPFCLWCSTLDGTMKRCTHWTPCGWRAVLFTLLIAIVEKVRLKEEEWKLLRCCLDTC